MSRHDVEIRLQHILDAAREAVAFASPRKRADLDSDRLLNLALMRLLEIIGEAATRVPDAERKKRPAIPWPQIVGMRNRLIHGYDNVNFDTLWDIVTKDLPPLIANLKLALARRPRRKRSQ